MAKSYCRSPPLRLKCGQQQQVAECVRPSSHWPFSARPSTLSHPCMNEWVEAGNHTQTQPFGRQLPRTGGCWIICVNFEFAFGFLSSPCWGYHQQWLSPNQLLICCGIFKALGRGWVNARKSFGLYIGNQRWLNIHLWVRAYWVEKWIDNRTWLGSKRRIS